MTIPISYNGEFLSAAPRDDNNQPSVVTDGVYNNVDMSPAPLPYFTIQSGMSNVNGFTKLTATTTDES